MPDIFESTIQEEKSIETKSLLRIPNKIYFPQNIYENGEVKQVIHVRDSYEKVKTVSGFKRFIHFVIDYFFIYVFCIISLIVTAVIIELTINVSVDFENIDDFIFTLMFTAFYISYYLLFEHFAQTTIGKAIMGCKVYNEYGAKPSFTQLLKRTFSRIIPFEVFSCLSDRGWHDTNSETYVIHKKELERLNMLMKLENIGKDIVD